MNYLERAKAYKDGVRILKDWIGDGGIVVDRVLAQDRAGICLTCSHNAEGWVPVEAVAEAIHEQVELKNKMELRVVGEKSLKTCSVCACPIALKIWCPIDYVTRYMTADQKAEFPNHCWIKKHT